MAHASGGTILCCTAGQERRPIKANKRVVLASMAAATLANPRLALAFEFAPEPDPVEPFTIYGSIVKKYLIEQIVKGKIVARKKGFTVSTCMNIVEASMDVPAGLKVTLTCGKGEGQSREESCLPPCHQVCQAVIAHHLSDVQQSIGYVLDPPDQQRVLKSCSDTCFKECIKPGKTVSFILPFRPRK